MADENKDDTPLPQYDRGKCKTELGFFQTLFRLKEVDKQGVIPAIVRSYDRKTGIATVQPIVTYVVDTKEGEKLIPRGTYDVSVIRFAHGGFVIDAPLFAGDTGWLIAADRNAKDAKEANSKILNADQDDENPSNEGFKRPTDDSLRSFSWGFFIPDTWGDTELTKNDGLVIKDVDGKNVIALNDGAIEIKRGDSIIKIEDGKISITGKETISIDGGKSVSIKNGNNDVTIDGNGVGIRSNLGKVIVSDSGVTASIGDSEANIQSGSASVSVGKSRVSITGKSITLQSEKDTITIDETGPRFRGPIDILLNLVAGLRFDLMSHQLQQRVVLAGKRGDFIVQLGDMTDWVKVDGGQAVPEYKMG